MCLVNPKTPTIAAVHANDSPSEPVARGTTDAERHLETNASRATRDHAQLQVRSDTDDASCAQLELYMRYATFARTMHRLMESAPDGAFTLYPNDVRDESMVQIAAQAALTPAEIDALIGEVRDEVVAEFDEVAVALGVDAPLPWPWSGCDADDAFKAFFGLPVTDTDDTFDDEYRTIRRAFEAMEDEVEKMR